MDAPEGLFLGKLIAGKILLTAYFPGYITRIDQGDVLDFGDGSYLGYPSSYGDYSLDVSRLTDSDIDQLLRFCRAYEDMEILFVHNPFAGGYVQYNINTTGSEWLGFPLEKVSEAWGKPAQVSGTVTDQVVRPDVNPEFPGGFPAMMKWLADNLVYPSWAQEKGVTGRVLVSFIVKTDGSVVDVKVDKPVHPELDAEALRVIRAMPKWKPGTVNGKPVNVRFRLPVCFNLVK